VKRSIRDEPPRSRLADCAEARSRRANIGLKHVGTFRAFRYVERAEEFARQTLGISQVAFSNDLEIANLCDRALLSLQRRGLPMPQELLVRAEEFVAEDQAILSAYDPGLLDRAGTIFINPTHLAWTDGGATLRNAGARREFSTGDPHHAIVHEMGGLAMHQSVPDRFAIFSNAWLADEREFLRQKQGKLRGLGRLVSRQAERSHSEFVAEVFAALMLGREELKEQPILMDAYTRFGGTAIRRYEA
jgi:hypothetical protein